jgi:hypothetical protein
MSPETLARVIEGVSRPPEPRSTCLKCGEKVPLVGAWCDVCRWLLRLFPKKPSPAKLASLGLGTTTEMKQFLEPIPSGARVEKWPEVTGSRKPLLPPPAPVTRIGEYSSN